MVSLDQKLKMQKNMQKNIVRVHCSFSLQKTTPKKHQILEKQDDFQNRPSFKGYSPYKGFCKMISLGQKLKTPKTSENRFYKNIRVVLCKKPLQKKTKYSRNETILKIGNLAKALAHAKAITLAKRSVWVKN